MNGNNESYIDSAFVYGEMCDYLYGKYDFIILFSLLWGVRGKKY